MPLVLRVVLYYVMFPLFVAGALCFYLVLRVRLCLVPQSSRKRVARTFIHYGARLLMYVLQAVGLVRLSVDTGGEQEALSRASIVVANHPSMLDAMLLLSLLPDAVCIMKRSLLRLPLVSGFAQAAGYLPQAEAPELLASASLALAEGSSVIIFPEGTRSRPGVMGEFRRGAARLSVETGAPLVVFSLEMYPVVLGGERRWWRPPTSIARYQAVRLAMGEGELEPNQVSTPEEAREESIRLTRCLEDRVRNSLLLTSKADNSGAL